MLSPFLICLTLIAGSLVQDNQPPKKTEAVALPAGTVAVSGRVVYEDTALPATRHRVLLIASAALGNVRSGFRFPTTITNERGEFSLGHVSIGEYYVYNEPIDHHGGPPRLNALLTRSNDDEADAARLKEFKKNNPRITVDGQRNVEVNLRVPNPHFGTISGTVFDATHQPAARATVHILTKGGDTFGASMRTDEQGRYKVWGLPKGEYIISASPPAQAKAGGEKDTGLQGSAAATYFPSTSLVGDSPAVVVLPDVDTANIDVTLISKTLRNLTGTVRMRGDNLPVTNATLRLSVRQLNDPTLGDSRNAAVQSPMSHHLSKTDQNGRWSFSNVPDGSYQLFVQPAAPVTVRFVPVEQELTVDGTDIEDMLIEVSEGARLSGVVVLEDSSAPPPHDIIVSAFSFTPNANATVVLEDLGKFTLTGVPVGEIQVSAFASPDVKFYVKSIEANGLDLLRNNLTIAEKDEIKDVRVVISTGVGVITGRVLSQVGDKPLPGINLTLYSTGKEKHRLAGGRMAGVTDERGNFSLSAAPGSYIVIAWRQSDGPGAFGAALNKATREQGTGLTLLANDRKQLDIRIQ